MKKKRIAALALLAPLTLLCACAGEKAPLAINTNWCSKTDLGSDISGTKETLTYDVSFQAPDEKDVFGVVYEGGTYVTDLSVEMATLPDETQELAYVYTTTLTVSGYYFYGEEKSETFTDSVVSRMVFRNASKRLAPIISTSEMKQTLLRSAAPTSLQETYSSTHYARSTSYNEFTTQATVTLTDKKLEADKLANDEAYTPLSQTVSIDKGGSYFDSEQILFALRGIDITAATSFYSIDPQDRTLSEVTTTAATAVEYDLTGVTVDGQPSTQKIQAYNTALTYNKTMAGAGRSLWYAKTVSASANTYRNVLLRMETPLMYGMGTLVYTLKDAQFANK